MKTNKQQDEIIRQVNGLKKFFEIEVTIRIFGKVIFHWLYPPQEE